LFTLASAFGFWCLLSGSSLGDESWLSGWDGFPYTVNPPPQAFPVSPRFQQARILQPLQQESPSFRIALRGRRELVLSATDTHLQITAMKQDLNMSYGADRFEAILLDDFERPLSRLRIDDDGQDQLTYRAGPVQTERMDVSLPAPGIYRLRIVAENDLRYDVITSAVHMGFRDALELIDSTRELDLFFSVIQQELEFFFSASYAGATTQTISLFDSNDLLVARYVIPDFNHLHSFRVKAPSSEQGKTWRLHVENQDLLIRSPQIEYWFLTAAGVMDFNAALNLLQPRRLEMFGLAGAEIPFRFLIENTASRSLEVAPALYGSADAGFTVAGFPDSLLIAGATKTYVHFQVQVPATAIADSTALYLLTLHDADGLFLGRSEAIVQVLDHTSTSANAGHMFTSPERLIEIRRKGQEGGIDLQNIYHSMIANGDRIVREHLSAPEEEAGWTGRYVCDGVGDGNDDPNDGDGASLIFDPLRPGVYICSIDGRRYHGSNYEEGWYGHYHYEMASRLRSLGIAYALQPKTDYAALAREMLMDYASRYRSWPFDDYQKGNSSWSARLMTETLGEAIFIVHALFAYDFTRFDPVYSPADRAHIEHNLIRPALAIIQASPQGANNWQAWHNAAIGLSGYVLSDPVLVAEAIYGPDGLEFLKKNAIRDDGLWLEGSIGYHFFALTPLELLLEAMEAHGRPAFDERIRSAHKTVLSLLYPDGSFPKLNDSYSQAIFSRKNLYEHAHAHYDDPLFAEVLSAIYDDLGHPRDTMESLFFGRDYEHRELHIPPALHDKMGLAILRSGDALDDLIAVMDYGPHGLGHGHYDKLHLSLYGKGQEWLPDLGIGNANTPEFGGWFRQTLGHNSILLGEQNQRIDAETERPIGFYSSRLDSFQAMTAVVGPPVYPQDANVRRTVLLAGNEYAVVIDDVSGGPGPYDFVFHAAGDLHCGQMFEPKGGMANWAQSQNGYGFLKPPRLFNGSPVNSILQLTTDHEIKIESHKSYGFGDDFENVDDWIGNVNVSEDATEGRFSLAWVAVPRYYQTIYKEFNILDKQLVPDRLVFDYKIEAATFSQLVLHVIGAPEFRDARWQIARGENAAPGEWRRAELDLTQPGQIAGSNLRARRLQFSLFGAEESDRAFRIFIDNLRVFRNDEPVDSEIRGLQFLFPGGEETQYILASGPSPDPPRVHPVVLVRRSDVTQTRHVAVLEPFLTHARIKRTNSDGKGELYVDSDGGIDHLSFDPTIHAYRFIRRRQDDSLAMIAMINQDGFEIPEMTYHAAAPSDFSIHIIERNPETMVLTFHKSAEIHDALSIRMDSAPEAVWPDGAFVENYRLSYPETGIMVTIPDLPVGNHEIHFTFAISTSVPRWRMQ
jgi:hypothetical protein